MTAAAVLCYAVGLFAYSVTKIQVPTFYALGRTRTPVVASVTAVSCKIAANFLFIWLLGRAGYPPFLGLALSTSLAAWINFGWLAVAVRRALGSFAGEGVVTTAFKMLGISVVMGLACEWLHGTIEGALPGYGVPGEIVRMAIVVAAGIALVGAGSMLLRVREADILWRRLRR